MTMMTIMKSYELSGEIELAHLKSNCLKSFVQYTRYELEDCRSFDLREKKNKKLFHRSQAWLGVQSEIFWFVFGLKERFLSGTFLSHLFWIRLTCTCVFMWTYRERKRDMILGVSWGWRCYRSDRRRVEPEGGAGGPQRAFTRSFSSSKVSLFPHISSSLSFSVEYFCRWLLERRVMHWFYFAVCCVHL